MHGEILKSKNSKNYNKIKQSRKSQYVYQNTIKMMPLIVSYHGLSTNFCVRQSILGRCCTRLWPIHRMCNISPPHKSWDNLVKLSLWTFHQRCDIRYLLASKPPYNAYISKNVFKIGIVTSYQFSHKTCHSIKSGFKIIFIKFQLFRKHFKNKFTTLVL